jgi:hypothetical protein
LKNLKMMQILMLLHIVIQLLICFLQVFSNNLRKYLLHIAHIYSIYINFIILRLILCSLLKLTQLYFEIKSTYFYYYYYFFLFALVCTVETMSSFSLPSSNQDQLMNLPQSSTSNIPTPESNLDSTGFSIADPFDFSILNKSKLNLKNFIYFCATFSC